MKRESLTDNPGSPGGMVGVSMVRQRETGKKEVTESYNMRTDALKSAIQMSSILSEAHRLVNGQAEKPKFSSLCCFARTVN